jgi:hypothetical protein
MIADLSQLDFRTPAATTVSKIIEFLNGNPTPEEIFQYHVSERAQERLRCLLMHNRFGSLQDIEELELDEIEKLQHLFFMFKADMVEQKDQEPGTL